MLALFAAHRKARPIRRHGSASSTSSARSPVGNRRLSGTQFAVPSAARDIDVAERAVEFIVSSMPRQRREEHAMGPIGLAKMAVLPVPASRCGGGHALVGLIGSWLAVGVVAAASAQALDGAALAIAPASTVKISDAADAAGYRLDGARHFYAVYADRIYQGKLPPLIHAVVVIETELDAQGGVVDVRLIRVPSHAPDVGHAVRDMIRQASPLPVPARMGGIRFVETWLVDKSGQFQLHALTEGQLDE
jgi:protein TonB